MNAELPISLVEPRDFTAALGGLVRALRQRADWTQPELASRSGVPVSTLSRLARTGLASTDRLAAMMSMQRSVSFVRLCIQEKSLGKLLMKYSR